MYDWEWEKEQEFIIDIAVDVDLRKSARSDDIADTVDWASLYKIAKEVIDGPTMYLIERIAETIATRILENERIQSTTISVRKNEILENGVPGVTITRTR